MADVRTPTAQSHDRRGSVRRSRSRLVDFQWRRWSTRHRVTAAVLGGLVGTHVATLAGFWFGPLKLTRLDYNTANGVVYLPDASPLAQFLYGGLSHYADGIFFALIFAIGLSPVLPFDSSRAGNMLKALAFSTLLGVLALFVTAPYVFGPATTGVYNPLVALDKGWNYVFSVLLWHWIYGIHLGLVYAPLDDGADETTVDELGHR